MVVSPVAAHANPVDSWVAWINEKNSGTATLLLDIAGTAPAPVGERAVVSQWDQRPDGSDLVGDQLWRMVDLGESVFVFQSAGTSQQYGLSIKDNKYSNGAEVIQWWFQPDNPFQRWKRENAGSGVYKFRNLGITSALPMCLAVAGAGDGLIEHNDRVILWDCRATGADQKWREAN
ncbi:RICIN domain-containing protein [Actinoplanes lobatus]|uniref:Ricin B lectin domain-containing protein n=1 Tax=Actinoplanes lobatus TaxID=113568 RepID=A0A7W7HLE4_9ACTN|nr:RICIN domain-containing protein [Actinoplanes lobatus]MBB4752706.1 hypothetical protein [Actinoplanes lobatus]